MPGDALDSAAVERLAHRWERAAAELRARAAAWSGRGDATDFGPRATAALTAHAEAASAAAQRLRDYCATVRAVDSEGARSVYQAIAAATSMSTAPIEEVITTPVSKA
ncbi:putative protein OS=Tsukamurella paurometabola OX=2061 GN=NCTC10741_01157 PE=4 SV=1 [Tsukamurella paurometabola]|nr:Uncharacterised protein [Tsukamurella paurometabola]